MNRFLYILLLLILPVSVFATHNRAGEITYEHLSGFTYKAKIVTYTKTSAIPDRTELPFNWGDGTLDTLQRISKVLSTNDVTINTYAGTHTYSGQGSFTMSFEDPNRNAGILNMFNSDLIPFYVQSTLIISSFTGHNTSVQLLEAPIDNGCFNEIYIHNPNAFDIDGDSLSYELTPSLGSGGSTIPSWVVPNASDSIVIDPFTGDFLWVKPAKIGIFNIAILIKEWRSIPSGGVQLVGSVMRDMQITIIACNNNAPVIAPIADYCVDAGDTVQFNVTATDANIDNLTLTSTGGPYLVANSATFPQPQNGVGSVTGTFTWQTKCLHVRKLPYQVLFKVTDDGNDVNLIDIERVNITVIGPAPKNPQINLNGTTAELKWNQSECSEAVSYKIYRRQGFYGFIPAPCETGVPAYTGYQLIGTTPTLTDTTFIDNNGGSGLIPGNEYCYMVVALYPDGALSYASVEICTELKRVVPVITNVTINSTDAANGDLDVVWSKPTEIDTIQAPGPYHYEFKRSDGFFGDNLSSIAIINDLNDTIRNEIGLDTKNSAWSYQIDIWNDTPGNTFLLGSSAIASSILLSTIATDSKNILNWEEHVPWNNTQYIIYRQNAGMTWDSIGTSLTQNYTDANLTNGTEYCYYVESIGSYSGSGLINPIINLSQEKCSTPIDNVPPCAPTPFAITDCISENFLNWDPFPIQDCNDDIASYSIYYTPVLNGPFTLLATINDPYDTSYYHSGLQASVAGCYYITATDSTGNESLAADTVCIDNCPLFELGNVFTPNADNINDQFIPLKPSPRFIESIDFKVYNRWGQLVFETTDPTIKWSGKHKDSGKILADGVYHYTCRVNEIYLSGIIPRNLTGFIQILDAKNFSE